MKLFENVATGLRMPLEALNGQKPFKKTQKIVIFMIFGLGPPWAWALGAAPIGPGVAALWECRRQFTVVSWFLSERPDFMASSCKA